MRLAGRSETHVVDLIMMPASSFGMAELHRTVFSVDGIHL